MAIPSEQNQNVAHAGHDCADNHDIFVPPGSVVGEVSDPWELNLMREGNGLLLYHNPREYSGDRIAKDSWEEMSTGFRVGYSLCDLEIEWHREHELRRYTH